MKARAAALALLAMTSQIEAAPAMAAPMSYAEFKAKVAQPPAPGPILPYGTDPLQHVELWKPAGKGPFPVVLMIHGGCWRTAVAKADIMHALAADLVARGIAVWNIEYRGIDVPGGGYPGTFRDVAAAADMLGRDGPTLGLDTRHVVAVGHSAGGHLAMWLAGRPKIARTSPVWSAHPLPIAGALSQGGLPDIEQARTQAAEVCGDDTIDKLAGTPGPDRRDVFADTSPERFRPLGVRQRLISGALDPVAPPPVAEAYAAAMKAAGDDVGTAVAPGAGHFELITPGTPAWEAQLETIDMLLGRKPPAQPRPR